MLMIRIETILSLSITLHGDLLGIKSVRVLLLVLLDVLCSVTNLIKMRPIGLTLILIISIFFRLVLRTIVFVNALHRRPIHVSMRAARVVILISIWSYFVHNFFGIKLWYMNITTINARIISDNLLMICDLGKIEWRCTINILVIRIMNLVFTNLLPFGVHRCLNFLLTNSILSVGKVFIRINLILIIKVTHCLQKLFLLFDLRNSFRAFALISVNIVFFLARKVFSYMLTIDSWHRCLSIICNIFIRLLSRLINCMISLVSIVSILCLGFIC